MSPGRTSRRALIVVLWTVSVLVTSSVLCVLFLGYVYTRSDRVVAEWKQPAGVGVLDGGPYRLMVVAVQGQQGVISPRYQIYVGPSVGKQESGRYFDFAFRPLAEDPESYIKRSQVRWLEDGVEFQAPDGVKLLIPKQVLEGE